MASKAADEFKEEQRPRSSDQSTHNFDEDPNSELNKKNEMPDSSKQRSFTRKENNHRETDSKK